MISFLKNLLFGPSGPKKGNRGRTAKRSRVKVPREFPEPHGVYSLALVSATCPNELAWVDLGIKITMINEDFLGLAVHPLESAASLLASIIDAPQFDGKYKCEKCGEIHTVATMDDIDIVVQQSTGSHQGGPPENRSFSGVIHFPQGGPFLNDYPPATVQLVDRP